MALVPVMLIVGLVVFVVMHVAPGDPAAAILGQEATQEAIDRLREEMGLNKPLAQQMVEWFARILRGDMGESIFLNRSVNRAIYEHLQATLLLTGLSLLLSVTIGIVAGVIAAVRHNKFLDQLVMFLTSLGVAVPNFWLGLMFILVFALTLGWLPVAGYAPLSKGVPLTLRYLALPALALALGQASVIARMTRANMLEVLQNDYIRTARAKGLVERIVIFKHALKNALIPTITVIGLTFANLMGGAVVTEQIFNIPGIGRLLITSVAGRDYPVIEGIVLYIAAAYVLINLIVDIVYMYVDPRIKI
ncbi:peptide ABC transporter [Clostridiales bacterium PH28_bin88]|nr:peptide ABC transporter [Clostridiales bacterium PH28_bin88]